MAPISPKDIDSEVLRIIQTTNAATIENIQWELQHLPESLVTASIKKLMRENTIALIINPRSEFAQAELNQAQGEFAQDEPNPSKTFVQDESNPTKKHKQNKPSPSPKPFVQDESKSQIRIKSCPAAGTAKSQKKYLWLYRGISAIAYIGGGHSKSAIAIKRKNEIEDLIARGVITPELPDEEIKRLVQGVKIRNTKIK